MTDKPRTAVQPNEDVVNTIGRALMLLGDQWTLLILQRAFLGAHRYQDWYEALSISHASLSSRIKLLVDSGLLIKVRAGPNGRQHAYKLSESGLGTWQIFVALWRWEKEWINEPRPFRTELVHDACGLRELEPEVVCVACAKTVVLSNVQADPESVLGVPDHTFVPRRHRQRRTDLSSADRLTFHAETMEIVGDRWSIPLLSLALLGLHRFVDFERALGIPPSVLSQRLRRFVELDVFSAPSNGDWDRRHEYRLSERGRAFFDVVLFLSLWSDQFMPEPQGNGLVLRHSDCGEPLRVDMRCNGCQEILLRQTVHFELGERA